MNNSFLNKIDSSWTLFLDRDGVINHEKHEDYINTWEEFRFYEGVKEAIKIFSGIFKYVIVITNQRGIGRGITKEEDLLILHKNMTLEIVNAGGRIDEIYFCPEISNDHPRRKPNPGMGIEAAKDFPGLNLQKSIMVGNTLSDMKFGRNIGAKTVFLTTTRPEVDTTDAAIDMVFPSLIGFAKYLKGMECDCSC